MKVREIFNLNDDFKSFKLLAGENGLDREIKDIEIVEIPDGIYWSVAGDIVITTAYYLFKENAKLSSWIKILNGKGVAGLGIKTGRFLKKISKDAIDIANEMNFPLFEIPVHVGYSDITWPIITKLLSEKDFVNRRVDNYNEELLAYSSKNYGTRDILNLMKKYLKNPFLAFSFYNNKIECISDNENKLPIANIISVINKNTEMIDTSSDFICIEKDNKIIWINAFKTSGDIIGYFLFVSNDESNILTDMKIAKLSYPYLTLGMLLEKSNDYLMYNSKEDFLKSIIYKKITNLIKLKRDAAYYNITFGLKRIVWIVEIKSSEGLENDTKKIREIIKSKHSLNSINIFSENHKIICISNVRENIYNKAWFSHLLIELEYKLPKCSLKIGVSKIIDRLDKLSIAYDEARFCLENSLEIEGGNVQLFDDLIIYYVLNEISTHPQLIRLYEDTIKRLHDYDMSYETMLVETIHSYIENNYNVLKTAEELYIHRNTLYKRLMKIENIINLNMNESDKNFILSLGLKLHKLYRS